MEQILTASLPTSNYIPKDAINVVTQFWMTILNELCDQPTNLEHWLSHFMFSKTILCTPIREAPNTLGRSPRELSTATFNGCSLSVRPPNGRRRWPKSAWPAYPPRPTASRATNSSSKTPSVQTS